MMSAAPPKRMVSSVFITLASPYRATVTPNPSHIHSTKATDAVSSAQPLGASEPQLAQRRRSSAASQDGQNVTSRVSSVSPSPTATPDLVPASPSPVGRGSRVSSGVSSRAESPRVEPAQPEPTTEELFPPPPPEAPLEILEECEVPPPPPPSTQSSPPPPSAAAAAAGAAADAEIPEPSLPPPPPPPPAPPAVDVSQPQTSPPSTTHEAGVPSVGGPGQSSPSAGGEGNQQLQTRADNTKDNPAPESKDLCGFCRKSVALTEPAIEALNRTYHAACFQCRQCHIPLAGKLYYNKAGIPLCEDCYQASLEPCWACGEVIKDHVIRALERAYHPPCFVCTTCRQPIGEQRFAQGEVGEVYCLQDYYRKYAPQCSACDMLIIPREDGTDSYTVECLGRSFHEDCYRCEVCRVVLSPDPNEQGCHPLDGQILCKPCHLTLVQQTQQ
ncbi:filamin-binding LIM protein 1 [Engraulis encrasicolus]|uniref:filamin-binding LIM protein 1 n=1 Tax=Engraulis encrasicolus TaxID=184585 RepID=UPI002FD0B368